MTLAEFVADRFDGTPAVGDRTRFGAVELIVRDMQDDAITQVGIELDPTPKHPLASWFAFLPRRAWWNNRGLRTLRHSLGKMERLGNSGPW